MEDKDSEDKDGDVRKGLDKLVKYVRKSGVSSLPATVTAEKCLHDMDEEVPSGFIVERSLVVNMLAGMQCKLDGSTEHLSREATIIGWKDSPPSMSEVVHNVSINGVVGLAQTGGSRKVFLEGTLGERRLLLNSYATNCIRRYVPHPADLACAYCFHESDVDSDSCRGLRDILVLANLCYNVTTRLVKGLLLMYQCQQRGNCCTWELDDLETKEVCYTPKAVAQFIDQPSACVFNSDPDNDAMAYCLGLMCGRYPPLKYEANKASKLDEVEIPEDAPTIVMLIQRSTVHCTFSRCKELCILSIHRSWRRDLCSLLTAQFVT
eukprot:GHVS01054469.1.p1 GENE.GHVS01054469.1~~GHVS01054469.1.p1  ORF type:complete len:321 (-),score=12.95 GHVS01054469.1:183-1145(-)